MLLGQVGQLGGFYDFPDGGLEIGRGIRRDAPDHHLTYRSPLASFLRERSDGSGKGGEEALGHRGSGGQGAESVAGRLPFRIEQAVKSGSSVDRVGIGQVPLEILLTVGDGAEEREPGEPHEIEDAAGEQHFTRDETHVGAGHRLLPGPPGRREPPRSRYPGQGKDGANT